MYCGECKREWIVPETGMYMNSAPLTITGNKRNDLCHYCGSGSIEYVEYTPPFLGGDIPRADSDQIPLSVKDTGENYFPKSIPMGPGYIANNLIAMLREDK